MPRSGYPDLDDGAVHDHLDGHPFERGGADGCRDHDPLGSGRARNRRCEFVPLLQ